jgi:arsenite-transporting ATPase
METGERSDETSSPAPLLDALNELSTRRVVLFGGKGGVGKTTIAVAAAIHYAATRPTILFTTDPASNLSDLFARESVERLTIEALDATTLYAGFLEKNLSAFLEIGDRGTYLDREELRRLFELAVPGIDELMAWMHLGELVERNPESLVVVDTAPTGHTLRMLSSSAQFRQVALALDAMQEKHRVLVAQFTRRDVRDSMDEFIDAFYDEAEGRSALLRDPARAAFIPVMLSEPLVVEQTRRLIEETGDLDVPFVILNRAHAECREAEDAAAREALRPRRVVDAGRACAPLDSIARLRDWMAGRIAAPAATRSDPPFASEPLCIGAPIVFLAGKGGVGKTTCAASIALQLAAANPAKRYVVISVDPAHSLPRLFEGLDVPPNLAVEAIDTRAKWRRFRDSFGERIEEAIDALTPRGMSIGSDAEAMRRMIELAPPGADELFAVNRLIELASDESLAGVVVDTAPTGHFLRLMELPRTAGEWVREFIRILLHYRDVLPAGSLGEELVNASRSLRQLDATLHSDQAATIVVTRPERIVLEETKRLIAELERRGMRTGGVIANYVTPGSGCACDRSMRSFELETLQALSGATLIERRERPPATAVELRALVPLAS